MAVTRTNEHPGTRAVLSSYRSSAFKFREVLDLIRGRDVKTAREILSSVDRDVARIIGKLLDSAIANAVNNDKIPADELFVTSCFADEGPTMKRFRARARGRAGAIRKRTAHVTVIVARMEGDQLRVVRSRRSAEEANRRARRVARTRGGSAERRSSAPPLAPSVETPSSDEIPAADQAELSSETSSVDETEVPEVAEVTGPENAGPDIDDTEAPDEASTPSDSEEEEK